MCVYCEVNEKGKRKKLFKKSQRIGSKGKLKSEAIIRKRKGPNKYFISASSWTGSYVRLLGEVICNYCPVCGREVNKKEEKTPPYSHEDYLNAKTLGLELDNWKDYQEFYNLGGTSDD